MSFDSLTNAGEYFSPHYLADVLPKDLKRDRLPRWVLLDKAGGPSPRATLRALRRDFFTARAELAPATEDSATRPAACTDPAWRKTLQGLHDRILEALGFVPSRQLHTVRMGERDYEVPAVHADRDVVAIECGWATDLDAALQTDPQEGGAGLLPAPVVLDGGKTQPTGTGLASFLFAADTPPRYVLIMVGAVLVLADRYSWGEGRYLAVNFDIALGRNDTSVAGELDTVAALFSAESLHTPAEGGQNPLADLVDASHQHAVGVSSELRTGLRRSVELIANEVLTRLREAGVSPGQLDEPRVLARRLRDESLRYLYRILFLLYAEARPDLGILPADYPEYAEGYGLARIGELVTHPLVDDSAHVGFHLYESLDLLFRLVNAGYRVREMGEQPTSEDEGLRFEALHSDLFATERITLIGQIGNPAWDPEAPGDAPRHVDTRLRNATTHAVLRLLMLTRGRSARERGGFISYAQLGINQLGAVYEGLMSYTGFIAPEDLYEVAKKGDADHGSWLIATRLADQYPDEVFVRRDDEERNERYRAFYPAGSFVYRLAGRDRQTSASYYTPESLTKATVQLALGQRIKENPGQTTAAELLTWKICEPALGSGAFLNEAINQVAAEYLRRRQRERGETIPVEDYEDELRKAKAFIALHNSYGVDLNPTAVELAEVSLWLNVMHPGLAAPWFGLHLRPGNSLIGAGRRYYPAGELLKGRWLTAKDTLPPTDLPFRDGDLPEGAVHHFLLPAIGWGAVAGEKEAKHFAPDDTARLAAWRRAIRRKPARGKQTQRLQALAGRAEFLWRLVIRRLQISEDEIARRIDVWGADGLNHPLQAVPRQKVYDDLHAEGSPYWRLRILMNTWCALWFWPLHQADLLDGSSPVYEQSHYAAERGAAINQRTTPEPVSPPAEQINEPDVRVDLFGDIEPIRPGTRELRPRSSPKSSRRPAIALTDLNDWLDFAESLLGSHHLGEDTLFSKITTLDELNEIEARLPVPMGMDSALKLAERFPWLTVATQITEQRGFFHWELDFAHIFSSPAAGFDLQLGNPPWVRPRWEQDTILAEHDPWFTLTEKPSAEQWQTRKSSLVKRDEVRHDFLTELAANTSTVAFLSSTTTYPLIAGTQPDLYRAFMCRVWANLGHRGTAGMLHPDTHFEGVREGPLRAAAYKRLRVHGSFVNVANWAFEDLSRRQEFGIHIYGPCQHINFQHLSQLHGATVLPESLTHDGSGEPPGQKFAGNWDVRPHRSRVVDVTETLLAEWQQIGGESTVPVGFTALLYPITTYEQGAISALASVDRRLGASDPRISRGYDEKTAKDKGLIRWKPELPGSWDEVILQGPHFGIATPFAKQPNDPFSHGQDWVAWDLRDLPEDAVPRTAYARACDRSRYMGAQDQWVERPYTEFYRLAWRAMIDPKGSERSLFAALIPPGPAHVHAVHSMAVQENRDAALSAGFWASLPLDYLLRITGRSHLQVSEARKMPAPDPKHPLASALLLRALRLNCLTRAYALLWAELFEPDWSSAEGWAVGWPGVDPLGAITDTWAHDTPLRTEYGRRAALVELDALVAVWLGIGAEELVAVYRSRYPILADREDQMYFDAAGRRIAADPYAFGTGQTKEHYVQLMGHQEQGTTPPEGYLRPFSKADRVDEMRRAHEVFSRRLADAPGWERG